MSEVWRDLAAIRWGSRWPQCGYGDEDPWDRTPPPSRILVDLGSKRAQTRGITGRMDGQKMRGGKLRHRRYSRDRPVQPALA
jgi:hypothetical protein